MDEHAKMIAELDKTMARIEGGLDVFLEQDNAAAANKPSPAEGAEGPKTPELEPSTSKACGEAAALVSTQCFEEVGPPRSSPPRRPIPKPESPNPPGEALQARSSPHPASSMDPVEHLPPSAPAQPEGPLPTPPSAPPEGPLPTQPDGSFSVQPDGSFSVQPDGSFSEPSAQPSGPLPEPSLPATEPAQPGSSSGASQKPAVQPAPQSAASPSGAPDPSKLSPLEDSFDPVSILPDEVLRRQGVLTADPKPSSAPAEGSQAPQIHDSPDSPDSPDSRASHDSPTSARPELGPRDASNKRRGLFSSSLGANVLVAFALATSLGIAPAYFWASGYLQQNRMGLLQDLDRSVQHPLRVEKGELAKPAEIRAEVLAVSKRATTRFYGMWVALALVGTGILALPYRRASNGAKVNKGAVAPA